jgi:NAD(P)-dependent dehydrogenase (short-subunit alcohol dehydrogenase family)
MFQLSQLFDLSGRTALVTGGSSGIGLAIARALGLAGSGLVLVARRQKRLAHAAALLGKDGLDAAIVAADLEVADGLDRAAEAAIAMKPQIDILINAAGFNLRQPFEQVSIDDFDRHMAVHLRAPFRLTQLLAPSMAQRGWGRIVNIASMQSQRAFPNSAPYGAAKGGIVQLTRAIAEHWSKHGITFNALRPGFFPTDLTAPVFADPVLASRNAAQTAIGRNGEMTDLYGAAVFLCSDASTYVTGQTLFVDGGFSAK